MKNLVNYFYLGRADGLENKPRAKGLKGDNKSCYNRGYCEGQQARTAEGTQRKQ